MKLLKSQFFFGGRQKLKRVGMLMWIVAMRNDAVLWYVNRSIKSGGLIEKFPEKIEFKF